MAVLNLKPPKKKSAANPKEELGNNWNFNLG
jgi:hypothetical protein